MTESKDPDYPVGSEWLYHSGWRTRIVVNPTEAVKLTRYGTPFLLPVPPVGDLPHSLALGTLGMPGYVLQCIFSETIQTNSGGFSAEDRIQKQTENERT